MLTCKTAVLPGAVVGAVVGAEVGAMVGPTSVDGFVVLTQVGYSSSGSNPSAGSNAKTLKLL